MTMDRSMLQMNISLEAKDGEISALKQAATSAAEEARERQETVLRLKAELAVAMESMGASATTTTTIAGSSGVEWLEEGMITESKIQEVRRRNSSSFSPYLRPLC